MGQAATALSCTVPAAITLCNEHAERHDPAHVADLDRLDEHWSADGDLREVRLARDVRLSTRPHHGGGARRRRYAPTGVSGWRRYWWTKAMAMLPSPTAAATRFTGPKRTSPHAKMPGTAVSSR